MNDGKEDLIRAAAKLRSLGGPCNSALADWLDSMFSQQEARIKAACRIWGMDEPTRHPDARKWLKEGPSGLPEALRVARSVLGK